MGNDIIDVQPLNDRRLLLTFENGEMRELDLRAAIDFKGIFQPLNDTDFFQSVRVNSDVGTIVWPNGADLCPDVLYELSTPSTGSCSASRTRSA